MTLLIAQWLILLATGIIAGLLVVVESATAAWAHRPWRETVRTLPLSALAPNETRGFTLGSRPTCRMNDRLKIGFCSAEGMRSIPRIKFLQLVRRPQGAREALLQLLEGSPTMPPRPRTIRLLHPIVDDAAYGANLTEPTLDEMIAIYDQTDEIGRGLATVAVFARLPLSVAEQLHWSDLWRLYPSI
jgi:hypothetical protein